MTIRGLRVLDVRCPTSRLLDGSDAVHGDPDYSAAYVVLDADSAARARHHLHDRPRHRGGVRRGRRARATRSSAASSRRSPPTSPAFHRSAHQRLAAALARPRQGRDPPRDRRDRERGLGSLGEARGASRSGSSSAISRRASSSRCIDWRYLSDALSADEALDLLRAREPGKAAREAELRRDGYPAYITSAGWLGYPEEKVRRLCRESIADGLDELQDQGRHRRRLRRAPVPGDARGARAASASSWPTRTRCGTSPRRSSGPRHLAQFRLRWIEEPTSPDDVLGHAAIRRARAHRSVSPPASTARTRSLFKQLLQAEAIDYCQVDACRLGGLNEVLAVLLLAARFDVPVCPHAGGLGLCEYVQHISLIDYVAVSGIARATARPSSPTTCTSTSSIPVRVEAGRYRVPDAPGYSIEMRPESLAAFAYPGRRRVAPCLTRRVGEARRDRRARDSLGLGCAADRQPVRARERRAGRAPPSTRPGTPGVRCSTRRRCTAAARRSGGSARRCAGARAARTCWRRRWAACCGRASSRRRVRGPAADVQPGLGLLVRRRAALDRGEPRAARARPRSTSCTCTTPTRTRPRR